MNCVDLKSALAELESAEDFLEYFDIAFDRAVVQVNRLQILQRFHDYLKRFADGQPSRDDYRACLTRAYDDFVRSDALTERVFRVHRKAVGLATVPLSAITRVRRA